MISDFLGSIIPSILACTSACKVGFANRFMDCVDFANGDAAGQDGEASATKAINNTVVNVDSADQAADATSAAETKDDSNDGAAAPSTCAVSQHESVDNETRMMSRSERIKLTRPVFAAIWQSLSLDSIAEPSFTTSDYRRGKDPKQLQKVAEGILNGRDLCNLLTHTIDQEILPTDEIEKQLLLAVHTAKSLICTTTLLPFVSLVLGQKFDRYKLDSANKQPSPESVTMVAAILHRYVHTCVGKEPQKPANWTRPTGRCNCGDCSGVNDLLCSPNQQVGRFPVNKKRRAHLHSVFNNVPGASYNIETLRNTSPNVWQITKNNNGHDVAHAAWKVRKQNAEVKLLELRSVGPLELYLGNMSSAILALDVDRIARDRKKQEDKTTVQADAGARHFSGNDLRGTKRAAADDINEAGVAKKGKPGTPKGDFVQTKRGLVEVVDLT